MAVEDLTTWTETDPDTDLTVTSTTVTVASLNAVYATQCFVSKDRGAGFYSGSFTHRVGPINISAASSSNSRIALMGVSMAVPIEDPPFDRALVAIWKNSTTPPTLELAEFAAGNNSGETPTTSDTYQGTAVNLSTNFYLELSRSGSTATLKLYSDAYTTLVDTLTFTISASVSQQFVFVTAKAPNGSGATVGATLQNVDLAPSGGGTPAAYGLLVRITKRIPG